jgi:TP901 family phage tail tape measure protein
MSDLALNILINAQDSASGILRNVGNAIKALGQGNVGGAIEDIGKAVLGIGVAAVTTAAQYQQSMNMVQALTGSNTQQMQQYDQQVKALAVDAGVAPNQLAQGLYQILSAGYSGAAAMQVLTLSTEDSKIGMTDAATTANALTNVLANFSWQTKDATQVNGIMLETVTLGKSTFQQYASTVTKAASVASQFKINLQTMSAAWATMTANGITAAHASTDFSQVVTTMYGKVSTLAASLQKNGIAFNEAQFNADNFGQKIQYLNSLIQQANAKHVQLTGVTLQAAQAVQVIASHMDVYNSDLATLSNNQAMAQKTAEAWAVTQDGFNQQMSRLSAAVQVLLIDLGQQFLPILTKIAEAVVPVITGFANWVTQSGIITNALNVVGTVLQWLFGLFQQAWSVLQQVGAAIAPIFDNLASQAQTWGQNVMAGFINGIESLIGDLESIMNDVATAIADFIGFASPSKKGPGRNLMNWGPAMVKGFADGIKAGADRDMDDAMGSVTKHFSKLDDDDDAKRRGKHRLRRNIEDHDADDERAPTSSSTNGANSNGILATVSLATSGAGGTAHSALKANTSALSSAKLALDQQKLALTRSTDAQKMALAQHKFAFQKMYDEQKLHLDQNKLALTKNTDAQKLALQEQKLHLEALKANTKALSSHAKSGGAGSALGAASNAAKQLAQVKIPDIGKQISDSINRGMNTIKSRATEIVSPITKAVSEFIAKLAPAWESIKSGALSVRRVVQSQLLPSFENLWNAIDPGIKALGTLARGTLNAIGAFAKWLIESGTLNAMWQGFIAVVKLVVVVISTVVNALASSLAPVVKQLITTWNTQLVPAFREFWAAIQPFLPALRALSIVLGAVLVIAIGILVGVIGGLLHGLSMLLIGAIKIFGGLVQIVSGAFGVITGIFNLFFDFVTGNWSKMGSDLSTIWHGIVQVFSGIGQVFVGLAIAIFGTIGGIVGGFIMTVINFFTNLYNALVGHSIIPDLVNGILQWFTTLITAGPATLQKLVTWITTTFTNLLNNATNWGRSLVQNIINGINSMVSGVQNAASNIAQQIADHLGWHSPTKKGPGASSDKWGGNLVKTIAHSMTEHISYINAAAGQIAAAANPWASQASIVNGIELPDYATGTGYFSMNTPYAQPNSAPVTIGAIHVHLNTSDKDADSHGKRVAEVAKRELAKMLRQQSIAPRYTSGGH